MAEMKVVEFGAELCFSREVTGWIEHAAHVPKFIFTELAYAHFVKINSFSRDSELKML